MRPVETIPGMQGGGKGEWWVEWIQLWHTVRTFVNATMYPKYNNNEKKKQQKIKVIDCGWWFSFEKFGVGDMAQVVECLSYYFASMNPEFNPQYH
jgi:hypothetical protein